MNQIGFERHAGQLICPQVIPSYHVSNAPLHSPSIKSSSQVLKNSWQHAPVGSPPDGELDGLLDGELLADDEGDDDGELLGDDDGDELGELLSLLLGELDGDALTELDGDVEGDALTELLGVDDTDALGVLLGLLDGPHETSTHD